MKTMVRWDERKNRGKIVMRSTDGANYKNLLNLHTFLLLLYYVRFFNWQKIENTKIYNEIMFNLFYTNCITFLPYSFTETEKKNRKWQERKSGMGLVNDVSKT